MKAKRRCFVTRAVRLRRPRRPRRNSYLLKLET
jgi:hypothetical protein